MLTPDQLRLRLDMVTRAHHDPGEQVRCLRDLLEEVLPDLIALANGRTAVYADADAGVRYTVQVSKGE